MLLFSTQLVLTTASMCTHHRYEFNVPKGAAAIILDLDYSPKYETDVALLRESAALLLQKAFGECPRSAQVQDAIEAHLNTLRRASNLITLSLDALDGFVGASHRQEDPIRVTIQANTATEGYMPHTIAPGTWTVWLHVHAVCSPQVVCNLSVHAEKEGIE